MSGELDAEIGSGSAEAAEKYPKQCSSLRKNGFVMIKGRPCKIVEMSTSKTGKHGHAKVHLVATDIFTDRKYEDICPSTHNMDVPTVKRKDYQVTYIDDDGYLTLLDNDGTEKDLKLPGTDLDKQINDMFNNGKDFQVTVLDAMGEEKIIGTKTMSTTK